MENYYVCGAMKIKRMYLCDRICIFCSSIVAGKRLVKNVKKKNIYKVRRFNIDFPFSSKHDNTFYWEWAPTIEILHWEHTKKNPNRQKIDAKKNRQNIRIKKSILLFPSTWIHKPLNKTQWKNCNLITKNLNL